MHGSILVGMLWSSVLSFYFEFDYVKAHVLPFVRIGKVFMSIAGPL